MRCIKCGSEILEGTEKCPVCGENIQIEENSPDMDKEQFAAEAQENSADEEKEEVSDSNSDIIGENQGGVDETVQAEVPEKEDGNQNIEEEEAESDNSVNIEESATHMEEPAQQENHKTQGKAVVLLKKYWIKGALAISIIALICCVFAYSQLSRDYKKLQFKSGRLEKDYDTLYDEYTDLKKITKSLQQENDEMSTEIDELKNGAAAQLVNIKNAFEGQKWDEVIKLTNALHSKYNGSAEDQEAQELAKQSQAKIDEAKAAEEAKKAQGYETGISYDQLARTPDDFVGQKVKFYGKVVQVVDGGTVAIRLAVDDNYDTIIYGSYSSGLVSQRVLEDDHITIYGTSRGTKSYTSTFGSTITIPDVQIEKIDQ